MERKSKTLRVVDALISSLCTFDETRKHIHMRSSRCTSHTHLSAPTGMRTMMQGGEPMGRRQVTTATAAPRRYNTLFLILLLLPLLRQARAKGKCLLVQSLTSTPCERRLAGFFIACAEQCLFFRCLVHCSIQAGYFNFHEYSLTATALCSRRAKQKQSREQNKRRAASEQAKLEDTHAAAAIVRSNKRALPRVVQIHAWHSSRVYIHAHRSHVNFPFVNLQHYTRLVQAYKSDGAHLVIARSRRSRASLSEFVRRSGQSARLRVLFLAIAAGIFIGVKTFSASNIVSCRISYCIFRPVRTRLTDILYIYFVYPNNILNFGADPRTPRTKVVH
uniref:Uncharacterized protein n=1 Tax=Trichogramma kaykai TaxID=54128 RepID=A0ABD2XFJ8_9HYME